MTPGVILLLIIGVAIVAAVAVWRRRTVTIIYPPNVGLMYHDGRFRRELGPGRYTQLDPLQRVRIVKVSLAPLPVPLGQFTVLSSDQFSFKLGLSPIVEVVDARAFIESQPMVETLPFASFMPQISNHAALQSLAAAAAHEVVAAHALRELFADSALLSSEIQAKLADAIPGARIDRILVTSITLPPETRKMFTEVERSKIEAEAALERARGEQASLRALANAARLVRDNPALANLRLLQTMEHAPGAKTFVLGNDALVPIAGTGATKPDA